MKETQEKNKKNMSNIRLNYEYVYNDYSDGDWKFHTLDYAYILGVRYDDINGRQLLVNTAKELLAQSKTTVTELTETFGTSKYFKVGTGKGENFRGAYYIEEYDMFITTSYGIDVIVKFIEKLLECAKVADNQVKVSFKA